MLRRFSSTCSTSSAVSTWSLLVPVQDIRITTCSWELDLDTVTVNVLGFMAVAQAAMRHFLRRGRGHLVGISSIGALRGNARGPPTRLRKPFSRCISMAFGIWRGTADALSRDRGAAGLCRYSHDETGPPVTVCGQTAIGRFPCKGSPTNPEGGSETEKARVHYEAVCADRFHSQAPAASRLGKPAPQAASVRASNPQTPSARRARPRTRTPPRPQSTPSSRSIARRTMTTGRA